MTTPRPLHHLSTPALCFAFGSCTRAPSTRDYERVLVLAGELAERGELAALVDSLEPDMRAALGMVLSAARSHLRYGSGQRRLS